MGMQPILPTTMPIKKIIGAARQLYDVSYGVVRCEQAFNVRFGIADVMR